MRELTRFTDKETGNPIYVDTEEIVAVSYEIPHMDYDVSPSVQKGTCTKITIRSGCEFMIEEHGSEVIAMVEGRDTRPAKILFGKKKKNDGNQT